MTKEILLKTELIGWQRGKKCKDNPYRARLIQDEGKEVCFQVGQTIDGKIYWASRWYVRSLLSGQLDGLDDELSIDWGQNWSVAGMIAALKEAMGKIQIFLWEDQK